MRNLSYKTAIYRPDDKSSPIHFKWKQCTKEEIDGAIIRITFKRCDMSYDDISLSGERAYIEDQSLPGGASRGFSILAGEDITLGDGERESTYPFYLAIDGFKVGQVDKAIDKLLGGKLNQVNVDSNVDDSNVDDDSVGTAFIYDHEGEIDTDDHEDIEAVVDDIAAGDLSKGDAS